MFGEGIIPLGVGVASALHGRDAFAAALIPSVLGAFVGNINWVLL
jgi:hypothetical protein